MEQLIKLHHSVTSGYNKSNSFKILCWQYYDKNNCFKKLEYTHSIINTRILNRITMLREEVKEIYDNFTISSYDTNESEYITNITDIDEWIKLNLIYIKKSHDNYLTSLKIIELIKKELGEYNYGLTYEIGWSIKSLFKLYIDLYSTKIVLTYKGKQSELSLEKLKTFLKNNKKVIIQMRKNEHLKYIKHQNELKEKQHIEKEKKKEKINQIYDTIYKVKNFNKISASFSINKSLKERYEIQACKPFPVIYPWNT